jgi:tRNA(Arg) A34 adenosine deaminase TadA
MANPCHHSSPETHGYDFEELSRRHFMQRSISLLICGVAGSYLSAKVWASDEKKAAMPVDLVAAEKFMRRAIELSQKGIKAGDGGPFGAVIVKDGVIIGEGWNHVVSGHDPTAHGEITAIRDAGQRMKTFEFKGCEIYTTGEPCPMCLCAIYWARMDRIFYGFSIEDAATIGFDDRFFYEQIAKPMGARQIPETQLLKDQAFAVARDYMANPNRTKY